MPGRLYGSLTTSVALAGLALCGPARLSGTLTTTVPLQGQVKATARLHGQVGTIVPLQGRLSGFARLYGDASTQLMVSLYGQVIGISRAYGSLSTTVALQGTTKSLSRLYGQVQTTVPLGGRLAAHGRLYGAVTVPVATDLAGRILGFGRLYGALTAPVALSSDPYDNTLVDSQSDMESIKATIPDGLSTTIRPDALTFDQLLAYTLGPETIGDAASGILGWAWYVRAEGNTVYYARSNDPYNDWEAEQELFTFAGVPITELDTAFEQNGRIVVVTERATGSGGSPELWVYWYDPGLADFVFEMFDAGRTPRVVLDNPNDTTISDVHIAYLKDGTGLLTRRQSELYATPHATVFTHSTNWYLEEFARNRGNRLVAVLSHHVGLRYSLTHVESTLYPVYPIDALTLGSQVLDTSDLITTVVTHDLEPDEFEIGSEILNTSTLINPLITHELYDDDELEIAAEVLDTSVLQVIIIVHELYDDDKLEIAAEVLDTSTLLVVLIVDDLDDLDRLEIGAEILSTSTLGAP